MTLIKTQEMVTVRCDECGHYRTRHLKGFGCLVCQWEVEKKFRAPMKRCKKDFPSFRLSPREVEQARAVSKNSYDGQSVCATCYEIWWAHEGLLCPNGETLFVLLVGGDLLKPGDA
ncbi:MAG: hypothetical protein ACJ8LM_17255 [Candidatus Udaeobacter sp.]